MSYRHVIIAILLIGRTWATIHAEAPAEKTKTVAVEEVKKAQKKLETLQDQIEAKEAEIKKKKRAQRKVEAGLGSLAKKLRYTEYKLKKAKRNLNYATRKSKETKSNLSRIRGQFENEEKKFQERIRSLYKKQDMGMVSMLLSPRGLVEDSEARYFAEKIMESDIDLLKKIQEKKKRLEAEEKKLKHQTRRIKALQQSIQREEYQIERQRKKKTRHLKSLKSQIAKSEAETRQLQASSQELTSFLMKEGKGQTKYYSTGKMVKPTRGWLSSKYGYRKHPISKRRIKHNGIDLAAAKGTKIKAANTGVVKVAGYNKKYRGYGKVTVIDHGRRPSDGKRIATVYAHQSRIFVKVGQTVKKGSEIGWVGSTGYSTGPHLHFEVRENGKPVNPLKYIRL